VIGFCSDALPIGFVVIHWPSGRRQELRSDALDQTLVIREP
jgi:hypothetical protein